MGEGGRCCQKQPGTGGDQDPVRVEEAGALLLEVAWYRWGL